MRRYHAALALLFFLSGGPAGAQGVKHPALTASIEVIRPSLVLLDVHQVNDTDLYQTGLVVANRGGHAFILAVGGGVPATSIEVRTGPKFDTPRKAVLIQHDGWTPQRRASWYTVNLALYDVADLDARPADFALGDVGSAPLGIAGFGASSIALWKLQTGDLEPKVVESSIAAQREWHGEFELSAEAGFGGGAVAFDEASGAVVGVLDGIGPLNDASWYEAHSADAIAAFLARSQIEPRRAAVRASVDAARGRVSAATMCLQGSSEVTIPWAGNRRAKPAIGMAVVVANDDDRSFLLTFATEKALSDIDGVTLPVGGAPVYPVSIVGRDPKTGMTLLAAAGVRLPALSLARDVFASTGIAALILGEETSVLLPCPEQTAAFESGSINVVHDAGDSLDQTAGRRGSFAGAPLFDARSGLLVGAVTEKIPETNEGFAAIGAPAIRAFLEAHGVQPPPSTDGTPAFSATYTRVRKSAVRVTAGTSIGSGIVIGRIDSDVAVLSAAHVTTQETATVFFNGDRSPHTASVTGRDTDSDLLLLRVHGVTADALPVGSQLAVGDAVAIAGFPKYAYAFSVADPPLTLNAGIVSSLYRSAGIFTHTAATDYGDSGAVVLDPATGCVLGVVAGEIRSGGLPSPVAFSSSAYYAVSTDRVRSFLERNRIELQSHAGTGC